MLTVEQVRTRIKMIDEARFDAELAHQMEDELRAEVLEAIAYGHPHARIIAWQSLRTSEIDFPRWFG